ncbi:MAG: hypothetical protein GXO69_00950 [Acidobacteria bacterium]|nr:hypothetical protein [Acidobacteriota bacterium]
MSFMKEYRKERFELMFYVFAAIIFTGFVGRLYLPHKLNPMARSNVSTTEKRMIESLPVPGYKTLVLNFSDCPFSYA